MAATGRRLPVTKSNDGWKKCLWCKVHVDWSDWSNYQWEWLILLIDKWGGGKYIRGFPRQPLAEISTTNQSLATKHDAWWRNCFVSGLGLGNIVIERYQMRWFGYLTPHRSTCPAGRRCCGSLRTSSRDFVSGLSWEYLHVPLEEQRTAYPEPDEHWEINGWHYIKCYVHVMCVCLCAQQRGQHQYSEQPAVQDGAVRQQPGEPGGGANTGLPWGETESWKPPLSNFTTVRKKKK